jgi:hypothetical protein
MSEHVATGHDTQEGVGAAIGIWMRQTLCALHGHDTFLHFERDRMSLKCVSCGHESPGWELDRARSEQVAERPRQSLPHLIGVRRVA